MNVLVSSPGMWVNVTNLNGGPKLSWDLKNSIQYQGEFIMVPHPAEPEKLFIGTSRRDSTLRDRFIFMGLPHTRTHTQIHTLLIYIKK